MFTPATRTALLAVALSAALQAPPATAAARVDDPACAALESSVLPAPDWYADQCLGGAAVRDYSRYREEAGLVPGDIAFYKNLFPSPLNVKTAPLATLTFTVVGPNPQPLFAFAFDNPATTLYAADNTSRQLGTVNQATGAFTSIGTLAPLAADMAVAGLAFDPTGTAAYLTATNGFTSNLFTVNLSTAALTLVGPITGFPFVVDIAIDRSGQMYGHDVALDALIRINKATGAGTNVGSTGMNANFAQGMMYDNSDDTLYGCAFVIVPAQQGQLVRFDRTTGGATIVAGPVPDELECAVRVPTVRMTPTALTVDLAGNRVMDPNETVVMAPTWRNESTATQTAVTGTLSGFTGPTGPTYTINDGTAAYGDVGPGASATCTANCYGLTATSATRPAQHWDTTVDEALSVAGQAKTWTLHIGGSFADVASSSPFYRFIETLFHRSITGGCNATGYCPLANTTREQMAVFVLVSREGAGYVPPQCAPPNLFTDVPETSPFCRFIEELATRGVVAGCGGGAYCPTADVTREQMAVFVLRTLDGALNPPACTTPVFNDVPATSPFCRWIEELARRGVVTGCGGGAYCPTAPVTREQMGVFLTVTFGLTLYGPN